MDLADLQQRVIAILTAETEFGPDGEPLLPDGFDTTRADLETMIQNGNHVDDLTDLARAMDIKKEMLTDPMLAEVIGDLSDEERPPDPEIFDAVDDGDIDALRVALKTCDVNAAYGDYDATALYRAMSGFEASLEVMHFLLDAGADPKKGLSGCNVLHGLSFAVFRDIRPEDLCAVVKRCIDGGADIEERTSKLQWTPLIAAVSEWNPTATEALLLAGADITARAGEVEGACFSGADVFSFAEGDDETLAVLKCYSTPQ